MRLNYFFVEHGLSKFLRYPPSLSLENLTKWGMFLEMEVDEVHHIATLMVSYLFYIDGLPSDLFDMWSCDSYSHLLELWLFTYNLEL